MLNCLNQNLPEILETLSNLHETPADKSEFYAHCIKQFLKIIEVSLKSKDENIQSATINLLCTLANYAKEEKTLLDCMRLVIYFMVSNRSLVSKESSLLISEMCHRNDVTPMKMFNWYQKIFLKLVVMLSVINFCDYRSTLMVSINMVSIFY